MCAAREEENLDGLIGEVQRIGATLNDLRARMRPILSVSTTTDSVQQVSLILELLQLRTTVESLYDDLAESYTPDHSIVRHRTLPTVTTLSLSPSFV